MGSYNHCLGYKTTDKSSFDIDWDKVKSETYEPYKTIDSGERKEYESGMFRDLDSSKPRYDLIYQPMLKRWAELMSRGLTKYTENDWKQANSLEELRMFKAKAYRHFFDWFNDEGTDEDTAAAIMFNISAVEYLREKFKVKNGRS